METTNRKYKKYSQNYNFLKNIHQTLTLQIKSQVLGVSGDGLSPSMYLSYGTVVRDFESEAKTR